MSRCQETVYNKDKDQFNQCKNTTEERHKPFSYFCDEHKRKETVEETTNALTEWLSK